MLFFLLSIPNHVKISVIKKTKLKEFRKLSYSCREINWLIEDNLKDFNIRAGPYFNIGLINKKLFWFPDKCPEGHDTKICVYSRFLSEVDYALLESFGFEEIERRLERFAYAHFIIIRLGTGLRLADDSHFSEEQITRLLEVFRSNKMTCNELEVSTLTRISEAIRFLKPKKLNICIKDPDEPLRNLTPQVLGIPKEVFIFHQNSRELFEDVLPNCLNVETTLNDSFDSTILTDFIKRMTSDLAITRAFKVVWYGKKQAPIPSIKIEELLKNLKDLPKKLDFSAKNGNGSIHSVMVSIQRTTGDLLTILMGMDEGNGFDDNFVFCKISKSDENLPNFWRNCEGKCFRTSDISYFKRVC